MQGYNRTQEAARRLKQRLKLSQKDFLKPWHPKVTRLHKPSKSKRMIGHG